MSELRKQLERIERDILFVLNENKRPMSQGEIYKNRKLNLSMHGWSYALERLEKQHMVEFTDDNKWKLKNFEDKTYLQAIENFCEHKIKPD